jgi:hypothetical protein
MSTEVGSPSTIDRSAELYATMREVGYASLNLAEGEFVLSNAGQRRKLYGPATVTVFVEGDGNVSLEYRIINGTAPESRIYSPEVSA